MREAFHEAVIAWLLAVTDSPVGVSGRPGLMSTLSDSSPRKVAPESCDAQTVTS